MWFFNSYICITVFNDFFCCLTQLLPDSFFVLPKSSRYLHIRIFINSSDHLCYVMLFPTHERCFIPCFPEPQSCFYGKRRVKEKSTLIFMAVMTSSDWMTWSFVKMTLNNWGWWNHLFFRWPALWAVQVSWKISSMDKWWTAGNVNLVSQTLAYLIQPH